MELPTEEDCQDFQIGYIYCIKSPTLINNLYVGSTIQRLDRRLLEHKKDYRNGVRQDSLKVLTNDDAYIEIIEELKFKNIDELRIKEEHFRKTLNADNSYKCYSTEEDKKDHIRNYNLKYREERREQISEYMKIYRDLNKDELTEKAKIYYANNIELMKEKNKEKYIKNRDIYLEYSKIYRDEHKEHYSDYMKQYRISNKEIISEKSKEKLHCDICNEYITKQHYPRHTRTNKHIANMTK